MTLSKLFVESYQLSFNSNMVLIKHVSNRKTRPLKNPDKTPVSRSLFIYCFNRDVYQSTASVSYPSRRCVRHLQSSLLFLPHRRS